MRRHEYLYKEVDILLLLKEKMTEIEKKTESAVKNNRSQKKSTQKIAQRRIDELFEKARVLLEVEIKYANNCVKLAKKISLRYKVRFSKEQKLQFCKNCSSYLHPIRTARLRVSHGKIKVLCLNCKCISRYVYK